MYADDWDDYAVPALFTAYKSPYWFESLNEDYIKSTDVFACPSHVGSKFKRDDISYGYNVERVGYHTATNFSQKFFKVNQVSQTTLIFADSFGFRAGTSLGLYKFQIGDYDYCIASRHNRNMNISFVDGHVESIKNAWGVEYCRLFLTPYRY